MFEGGRPPPAARALPAVEYRLLFDLPLTGRKIGPLGLFYMLGICCWRVVLLLRSLLSLAWESMERSSRRSREGFRPYFWEIVSTSSPTTGFGLC